MNRRGVPPIAPTDLRDHADEARIARVWDRIENDLAGVEAAPSRGGGLYYALVAATLAAFAGGLVLGKAVWDSPSPSPSVPVVALDDKPEMDVLAAGSEGRTFPLPGGGLLRLEPEATVEIERTPGGGLTLRLVQGEASIDTAGAPDRAALAIVAGEARLSTRAGSVLSMKRNADDLDVMVKDGSVDITDAQGLRHQLRSGDPARSVSLRTRSATAPTSVGMKLSRAPAPLAAPEEPEAPPVVAAPAPDWRARHSAGEYRQAHQLLSAQPGGVAGAITAAKSATELVAISDVTRGGGGSVSDTVRALQRVVDDFASDPYAQVAAYTLAKIYGAMNTEEAKKEAQKYLERSRSLGGALAPDALCKQISTANKDDAVRLAKEYVTKYPNDGRCKEEAEGIIAGGEGPGGGEASVGGDAGAP
jgi:FecR protein